MTATLRRSPLPQYWALAACLLVIGCAAGGPTRRPGSRLFLYPGSELIHDSGLRSPQRGLQERGAPPRSDVAPSTASPVRAHPPPPFSSDAYCDEHGHFTYDGAAQALVLQPDHLRQVYLDATRGQARAKELVQELEEIFHCLGLVGADAATRPTCLALPELTPECMPNWQFLQEFLGRTPEADRLREVTAQAYEGRARRRGAQNAAVIAALNLLWAGHMANVALSRSSAAQLRAPLAGAWAEEAGAARGGGAKTVGPVTTRFDPARARHLFREASGHVNPASSTAQGWWAKLFERVASNPANLRADAVKAGIITQEAANAGVQAFTWTASDGQVWVIVRDGVIQNAGVNPLGAFR